ncbi:MAG: outer membrane lipoprotein-sorting protein [Kiritimatiellia bacterium]|nr:outer membrane lipoprotein-sorting protein [Kiritimatiellia bacterium]MDP6631816.1 outer membrane lipoprotein-sorting protein [Kiritimatiellia bacterium]MDP6811486.1 outer membrane lipoprotein-sorting protein [Kiritimatiellia bacterium]MDP7023428.1 outer membrane lipoprotein-sorting protein [Kiritimatiellia bacterium]
MAMALVVLAAQTVATVPALSNAAEADLDPDEPPITADGLLDDVLLRFPRDPLDIRGEMIVRKRRGVELARVPFEMAVDWGADPARFHYRVLDAEGGVQRELALRMRPGGRPEPMGESGDPIDLDSAIVPTDLTWADLSLSFLWWRGGRIVGTDRVKGRDCYLVDVPAPEWGVDSTGYSRVRLWVDQSLHMLLRADGFDAADKQVRSLWVRSLKKTDGRWMIKDMEVQGYPSVHRTRLRIHSVRAHEPQASCLGYDGAPPWGAGRTTPTGSNNIAQRVSLGSVKAS